MGLFCFPEGLNASFKDPQENKKMVAQQTTFYILTMGETGITPVTPSSFDIDGNKRDCAVLLKITFVMTPSLSIILF